MNTLQYLAWIFVHIVIPVFAPIALLPLLAIGRTFRSSANGVVYNAVKNGQLLWVGIAMSAGACYEIGIYLERATGFARVYAWLGLAACILIITISAVLVMLGAIDGLDESGSSKNVAISRIMVISILLTTAAAGVFGVAHYLIAVV
jgi:hypothetical protein